jgi:uncharacterized membrane protein
VQATTPSIGRPYPPPAAPEPAWPSQLTIVAAIALQLSLPEKLSGTGIRWLLPALEALVAIALITLTPRRLVRRHPNRRRLAIALVALVSAANVLSLGLLAHYLVHTTRSVGGRELILAGMLIWLTNFLIFGLWYWEIDRGGPGTRAEGEDGPPDFLFPQMNDDVIQPPGWRPKFIDYLYVALTNAAAFSPTDTMPLTPMAKSVMGLQSIVSIVTIGLIISRAVNIL